MQAVVINFPLRIHVSFTHWIFLRNAKGQCEYSGKDPQENECVSAHSLEELKEWEHRQDRQMLQLKKARDMNLFTWLDDLVFEIDGKRRPNVVGLILTYCAFSFLSVFFLWLIL